MKPQPILVIGGTRGTGLLIARLLHQSGQRVRVLARVREHALTLFDPAVEIVEGNLTRSRRLPAGLGRSAPHHFYRGNSQRLPGARASPPRRSIYDGMCNTLAPHARNPLCRAVPLHDFKRWHSSVVFSARCLNLWKGNTLVWRHRAEDEIRASGLNYTIIRSRRPSE